MFFIVYTRSFRKLTHKLHKAAMYYDDNVQSVASCLLMRMSHLHEFCYSVCNIIIFIMSATYKMKSSQIIQILSKYKKCILFKSSELQCMLHIPQSSIKQHTDPLICCIILLTATRKHKTDNNIT